MAQSVFLELPLHSIEDTKRTHEIIKETRDKQEQDHVHKMSHAALDVRNALLTKLWEVRSMQIVVKKFLKLDNDTPLSLDEIKEKTMILMGSIIGMSAVADNLAAMLFGINVLEDIADKLIANAATLKSSQKS